MIVRDEKLLKEFRAAGWCELCCQAVRTEPHHIVSRGHGGGCRLDIRENLIAVGASLPFPACGCHAALQAGTVPRSELWLIVGRREGLTADQAEATVWETLRAPKAERAVKPRARTLGDKVTDSLLSWGHRIIVAWASGKPLSREEVGRYLREASRFGVKS